jgi:hypothetical protein
MSNKHIKTKLTTGAVLVALSGFVPQITANRANAASATIAASGTFSSGIKMTAASNLRFGLMVATSGTGKMSVTPGNGTNTLKGFYNGGTQAAGKISFSAGALKVVDITVTGMKNTLALGSFGGTKTGIVNLPSVFFAGPVAGTLTFKTATTKQTAALTSTKNDIAIGGAVTWGATLPVGTFSQTLSVTVAY